MNLKSLGEGFLSANTVKSTLPTVFFEEQELPLSDNVLVYQQNIFYGTVR